jgi:hypothetical protein
MHAPMRVEERYPGRYIIQYFQAGHICVTGSLSPSRNGCAHPLPINRFRTSTCGPDSDHAALLPNSQIPKAQAESLEPDAPRHGSAPASTKGHNHGSNSRSGLPETHGAKQGRRAKPAGAIPKASGYPLNHTGQHASSNNGPGNVPLGLQDHSVSTSPAPPGASTNTSHHAQGYRLHNRQDTSSNEMQGNGQDANSGEVRGNGQDGSTEKIQDNGRVVRSDEVKGNEQSTKLDEGQGSGQDASLDEVQGNRQVAWSDERPSKNSPKSAKTSPNFLEGNSVLTQSRQEANSGAGKDKKGSTSSFSAVESPGQGSHQHQGYRSDPRDSVPATVNADQAEKRGPGASHNACQHSTSNTVSGEADCRSMTGQEGSSSSADRTVEDGPSKAANALGGSEPFAESSGDAGGSFDATENSPIPPELEQRSGEKFISAETSAGPLD